MAAIASLLTRRLFPALGATPVAQTASRDSRSAPCRISRTEMPRSKRLPSASPQWAVRLLCPDRRSRRRGTRPLLRRQCQRIRAPRSMDHQHGRTSQLRQELTKVRVRAAKCCPTRWSVRPASALTVTCRTSCRGLPPRTPPASSRPCCEPPSRTASKDSL